MDNLKEVFKWIAYITLAVIAIGVLATGGLLFLVIGASIGAILLGGFIIMILAAGIKEYWETSHNK